MDDQENLTLPAPSGNKKTENQHSLTSAPLPQAVEEALDEIELRLRKMLALARLSASASDVDRMVLQKKLERLREEIDRIANEMQQN